MMDDTETPTFIDVEVPIHFTARVSVRKGRTWREALADSARDDVEHLVDHLTTGALVAQINGERVPVQERDRRLYPGTR